MQAEPTEPYVYQPEPVNSPLAPRLWGIGGPGTEKHAGERFTKDEAEEIVRAMKMVAARRKFLAGK